MNSSTPLHIANGTQDRGYRHQPVDHCRIQHTTSHTAKPHVSNHTSNLQSRNRIRSTWSPHTNPLISQRSWCTNPPTEGHRHSQATETGRWPQRHLHIPTPYPALRATDSTHFAIFILSFILFLSLYFRFCTLCVYHFLCTYLVYIVLYLPIHRKPDYEISASGSPTSITLSLHTEPEDGLYIGWNM